MAGLPLNEVVETAIAGVHNDFIRRELTDALEELVNQGRSLTQALIPVDTISRLEIQALIAGEKSGKLPETFQKLAERKHEQSEQTIKILIAAMDPLLMIVIGGIVGVVVIAIYLPTVSMAF